MDFARWTLVAVLLVGASVAGYYLNGLAVPLRMAISLAVFLLAGLVAIQTQKGRVLLDFFRDSKAELRKVVWPTREETLQTTAVVAVMVVILALLLWGVDGVLVWLIGWLTGQRG